MTDEPQDLKTALGQSVTLCDGLGGIINLDTDIGMDIGFTSDKYGGYFTLKNNAMLNGSR